MKKQGVTNYDLITFYFGETMKKAYIIPSDNLRDYFLINTRNFSFNSYTPRTNEVFEHIMFTNFLTSEKYSLFYNDISLHFRPEDHNNDNLLDLAISKKDISHLWINEHKCFKQTLNENGLLEETYHPKDNEIYLAIYSYRDTVNAYKANAALDDELPVSYNWELPLLHNKIQHACSVHAFINHDNEVEIEIINGEGILLKTVWIPLEPGMSLYEVYSDYVSDHIKEILNQQKIGFTK